MGLLKDLKFELYTLHRYANKLMNKTSKTATLRAQSAPHTILVWAMMYIGKCVYLWGQSDGITLTGDVWEHWGPSSSSPSSPCLLEGHSSPSPDHSGPYLPSPGLQTSSSQSRLESKHTYILYPLTNTDIFLPPKTPPHTPSTAQNRSWRTWWSSLGYPGSSSCVLPDRRERRRHMLRSGLSAYLHPSPWLQQKEYNHIITSHFIYAP